MFPYLELIVQKMARAIQDTRFISFYPYKSHLQTHFYDTIYIFYPLYFTDSIKVDKNGNLLLAKQTSTTCIWKPSTTCTILIVICSVGGQVFINNRWSSVVYSGTDVRLGRYAQYVTTQTYLLRIDFLRINRFESLNTLRIMKLIDFWHDNKS